MFAQRHKYPKDIPPRKYTIDELLKMKRTLPYVSCPLSRFKPEAWTENVLSSSKVPALPASMIERRKPRRYVPEPETLDPDTMMRVETLLPMMNYNPNPSAAYRQPAPPLHSFGSPSRSVGFGKNISQTVSSPVVHPGTLYGAAPLMASPLSPSNPGRYNGGFSEMRPEQMMSPSRSSRKPYSSSGMAPNQDTILSVEDLAKMGIHLVPPPAMVPQASFPPSEYSGGYGSLLSPVSVSSRPLASQGFVPGGTLKTGPTTGLTPVNESPGMQWENTPASMQQSPLQKAFNQRTNQSPIQSAFYAGVGVPDKENSNMSSTYRGITATTDSMKNMSLKNMMAPPPIMAPPPGLALLGNRATRDEQQAFIEYMTRRASTQRYVS